MSKKIFFLSALFLASILLYFAYQIYVISKPLQVVFLDVGQGDSILIQKGMRQILIDGGPNGKTELAELGKYLPYFDREIEVVIATHPDRDHIGGLVDVARNYKIGKVLSTGAEKDTQIFEAWKDVLAYNRFEILEAVRGTEIEFDVATLKIINPPRRVSNNAGESNNSSVVARFDYGENSFLLTGDIETPAEEEIIASGENIDVDVLKVTHHGSKYSSSDEFLDATSPEKAVISVGAKNSYGHPADSVLEALHEHNADIFRTDQGGDVVFTCSEKSCTLHR